MKKMLGAVAMAAVAALTTTPSHAVPVGLELALMADVSGSLDSTDFNLQRDGYVAAFRDASVQSAITAAGGIAVTLVYWSSAAAQSIGWTLITNATEANAFADAIAATARPSSGGTAMTNALNFTSGLFANNGFEGTREVIDVSGDGSESDACSFSDPTCAPLQAARNAFLGGGTNRTINALWIDDRDFFGDDPSDTINALDYGNANVIGGPGAFQAIAQDFAAFEREILTKIGREIINHTPAPGGLPLVAVALAGLALMRRRQTT